MIRLYRNYPFVYLGLRMLCGCENKALTALVKQGKIETDFDRHFLINTHPNDNTVNIFTKGSFI